MGINCDKLSNKDIDYSITNSNKSEWGCLVRYFVKQSYLILNLIPLILNNQKIHCFSKN
jgi:hypothetical protein